MLKASSIYKAAFLQNKISFTAQHHGIILPQETATLRSAEKTLFKLCVIVNSAAYLVFLRE